MIREYWNGLTRWQIAVGFLALTQIVTFAEASYLVAKTEKIERMVGSIPEPEPAPDLDEVAQKIDTLDTDVDVLDEKLDRQNGEIDSINLKMQDVADKLGVP